MKCRPRNLLAHTYNEITALVSGSGPWLSQRMFDDGPYARAAVVGRLQQRLAELMHVPLLALRINSHQEQPGTPPVQPPDCAGLRLNIESGQIHPRPGLVVRSCLEFFKHWLFVLYSSPRGLFSLRKSRQPAATLVLGVGELDLRPEGSDEAFIRYCRMGPIDPLRQARHLIVQSSNTAASSQPALATYAKRPLLALLHSIDWTLRDYLCFLRFHLSCAGHYLLGICRFPLLSILAYDYAYFGLVSALNRKQAIENFVITNSLFAQQPLWMTSLPERSFKVHMVFYSMMGNAFVYRDEPVSAALPAFRYLRADAFWVWTQGQAAFLRELGVPGETRVVGPILWQLEPPLPEPRSEAVTVCVFDVTPLSPDAERQHALPKGNYYETRTALQFMEGILAARQRLRTELGINLRVILKHKRPFHPIHDARYVTRINAWEFEEKVIERAPSHSNIFSLLQESALAIVIPFSSPAYVAAHLGVTAIFFDPDAQLEARYETDPHILFASSAEQLFALMRHHLTGQSNRRPAEPKLTK